MSYSNTVFQFLTTRFSFIIMSGCPHVSWNFILSIFYELVLTLSKSVSGVDKNWELFDRILKQFICSKTCPFELGVFQTLWFSKNIFPHVTFCLLAYVAHWTFMHSYFLRLLTLAHCHPFLQSILSYFMLPHFVKIVIAFFAPFGKSVSYIFGWLKSSGSFNNVPWTPMI